MITRTLFLFGFVALALAYPAEEVPSLDVQPVRVPPSLAVLPSAPPSGPVDEQPSALVDEAPEAHPAQVLLPQAPVVQEQGPVSSPGASGHEQAEDLAASPDANIQVGDKTDLETANSFWGGYGGYGGYGWGGRRSYYGGWGRGWGGWGGYGGWGGRSYYRPWGGWGGWGYY